MFVVNEADIWCFVCIVSRRGSIYSLRFIIMVVFVQMCMFMFRNESFVAMLVLVNEIILQEKFVI